MVIAFSRPSLKLLTQWLQAITLGFLVLTFLSAQDTFATPSELSVPELKLKTTAVNPSSPHFLLGQETAPNIRIKADDNPDMGVQLGIRFQGSAEHQSQEFQDGSSDDSFDFYGRRIRLEVGAQFTKDLQFYMDLRSDRTNQGSRGAEEFEVGDAKLTWKEIDGTSRVNLAAFRAKIDVSRSETIKSGYLINFDRPAVADAAANWVSEGRRAMNLQFFGDWQKKVHYQLAVGDGVSDDSFVDALDQEGASLASQSRPMIGGKIRFSPISGWEETKRTETYFGQGKHLSAGVGYFFQDDIEFTTASTRGTVDRRLLNLEFSGHYQSVFIQAEYFMLDGALNDFTATSLRTGDADGWYVLGEYVIPELSYVAPFIRYDYFDSFSDLPGYEQKTLSSGVNWYLKGNSVKVGALYEHNDLGDAFSESKRDVIRLTTQLFF